MTQEIKKELHTETIIYGENCHGHLTYDPSIKGKRPAILVVHDWKGQSAFTRQKAQELAQMGYVAFCADLYQKGTCVTSKEQALQLMLPLFLDRHTLRSRISSALDALNQLAHVDAERIGAIGFCFGGLVVIELMLSGAPVHAAVSFHGVLGRTLGDKQAKLAPSAERVRGSVLLLHGADDPMVSADDVSHMQQELTRTGADWQMNIYGHTMHAFTNPEAKEPESGILYEPQSARRSWVAMANFFEELLAIKR